MSLGGRNWGVPQVWPWSTASILGHPGASPRSTGAGFSSSPRSPLLPTARGSGGLLTLTLRGKAMDGFEEQQGRTRPQLSHRAWKAGGTDAGFPQRQQGRRRSVAWRCWVSAALTNGTNDLWSHEIGSDRLRSLLPSTFHAARDIPHRRVRCSRLHGHRTLHRQRQDLPSAQIPPTQVPARVALLLLLCCSQQEPRARGRNPLDSRRGPPSRVQPTEEARHHLRRQDS